MNTKILTKVLEELNKENPDISYVRGMVETLVSLDEKSTASVSPSPNLPRSAIPLNGPDMPPLPKFMNEIVSKGIQTE